MSTLDTSTPANAGLASFDRLSAFSYPLVRITTGLLLMPHGAQKLFGWFGGYGLTATGEFFGTQLGMQPGILFALLAGLVEFFGGLALVLGLLTRPAALGVAVLMAVAVFAVHLPSGFFWTGGGYEYPLMWGLLAVALFLGGGGRYSLDRRFGLPL
ncbi:MAG TPA: DoxX family protein [Arenibaculum sp.]|nr:DoxX family protein [Arenibaculum sp.]